MLTANDQDNQIKPALRIAFDVGGVLSRYPTEFRALLLALHSTRLSGVEVHIISDMHPVERIVSMLGANDITVWPGRVHSADYNQHGELCKARLCQELGIDILVDDFPGYVAAIGAPMVRLLTMPDPRLPYYHDTWVTDGSEGDFGRRRGCHVPETILPLPVVQDDPVLDGTDGALPSWWRGNDAGCRQSREFYRNILDGKDDGRGVVGDPAIERLRRDILDLMARCGETS